VSDRAAIDAQLVLEDMKAPPEARAKALAIRGLVQRNLGNFTDAKATLDQALKAAGKPDKTGWQAQVQKARAELSDQTVHYLPETARLHAAGQLKQALATADTGLKIFPNEGKLLALRSQVRLDLARQSGKLTDQDPRVAEIRQDATAAIDGKAVAEGNFALGRLAETLGNLDQAKQHYQQALDAHPAKDQMAARYRLAMARVLLLGKPLAAPAPPKEKEEEKTSRRPAGRHPLLETVLILMMTTLQEPGGAAKPDADIDRAIALADEAIKLGIPEAHLLKAEALARKGLWTEALQEYVTGLEKLPTPPPDYAKRLNELVSRHPAFRIPDTLSVPEPLVAEKHYAKGLSFYNARRYADAEKEFTRAINNDAQDARYWYYLGLSRLALGNRDEAIESFRRGSILERESRPNRTMVSESLERIQGPRRQVVNEFRP
jgi:tetratricopeptide (TPR) repeat protein